MAEHSLRCDRCLKTGHGRADRFGKWDGARFVIQGAAVCPMGDTAPSMPVGTGWCEACFDDVFEDGSFDLVPCPAVPPPEEPIPACDDCKSTEPRLHRIDGTGALFHPGQPDAPNPLTRLAAGTPRALCEDCLTRAVRAEAGRVPRPTSLGLAVVAHASPRCRQALRVGALHLMLDDDNQLELLDAPGIHFCCTNRCACGAGCYATALGEPLAELRRIPAVADVFLAVSSVGADGMVAELYVEGIRCAIACAGSVRLAPLTGSTRFPPLGPPQINTLRWSDRSAIEMAVERVRATQAYMAKMSGRWKLRHMHTAFIDHLDSGRLWAAKGIMQRVVRNCSDPDEVLTWDRDIVEDIFCEHLYRDDPEARPPKRPRVG